MKINDKYPSWDAHFYRSSPMFQPLSSVAQLFDKIGEWPTIEEYNDLFQAAGRIIKSANAIPLQFVKQSDINENPYEASIFFQGKIATRLANWHDFFNILCWHTFPKTKACLNQLQTQDWQEQKQQGAIQRTKRQNQLAHFDETGTIIVASESNLLTLIREHQWHSLFLQQRNAFAHQLAVIIFGHGLYEKALNPYVGMTGKAILLQSSQEYFTWPLAEQLAWIDAILSQHLLQLSLNDYSSLLAPFPLLGVPGWYSANDQPAFYDNINYFRPKVRT